MMTRSADLLYRTEYIHNVLYFATVRPGKILNSTLDTHYFSIDNELIYENYYSDFGPLDLGCVYKYCKLLNGIMKQYLNKRIIVHYTSNDAKKKANSAFLMGCYGVLYLSLTPKDAIRPLIRNGQHYRPFQDATQGDSEYTISLLDCLQGIKKARDLGLFDFQDFNFEEYIKLDKLQGGDLNWIIPGKFLAFIGPVEYSLSLYHPPEMYIHYFQENNVRVVIRLNERCYDGSVFTNAGIVHYDLYFPDGSCPPRNILFKFLQISEATSEAIAVHCKAGLGRTGSLIGCYLIKHYRMTAHEAISWMRICRPGSVIGHQQAWLEKLEAWLIKQGNLYRKHNFQDIDKFPTHHYGVYSITEKTQKQKPLLLHKSPSPPPPMQRHTRSNISPPVRIQASRNREATCKVSESEKTTAEKDKPVRMSKLNCSQYSMKGDQKDANNFVRGGSGGGDPRVVSLSKGGIGKNILMRSTIDCESRRRQLESNVTVAPHCSRVTQYSSGKTTFSNFSHATSSSYFSAKGSTQPQYRRRLGRSPSPPQLKKVELSRGTNTQSSTAKLLTKDASKIALKDALSRLKLSAARDGSIGTASLGARREAPSSKRAPSVRSDEPLATQGDLLNSIKFQRRLRESIHLEKTGIHDKVVKCCPSSKEKCIIAAACSRNSSKTRCNHNCEGGGAVNENSNITSRGYFLNQRPLSPKGRRNT